MSLIVHYRLDGNANDASGNGYDGTPTAVSFVAGQFGQAGSFDGTNSQIVRNALPLAGVRLSAFAWIQPASFTVRGGILWNKDAEILNFGLVESTGLLFYRNASTGKFARSVAAPVSIGSWAHVGVVLDSSMNPQLYVNGAPVAQTTTAVGFGGSTDDFRVGRTGSSAFVFDGLLDEVRIYNEEVPTVQINTLIQHNYRGLVGVLSI